MAGNGPAISPGDSNDDLTVSGLNDKIGRPLPTVEEGKPIEVPQTIAAGDEAKTRPTGTVLSKGARTARPRASSRVLSLVLNETLKSASAATRLVEHMPEDEYEEERKDGWVIVGVGAEKGATGTWEEFDMNALQVNGPKDSACVLQ